MNQEEKRAKPHHSMGRSMLIIAWALVFVGLVAFFGSWESKQINPN